MALKPLGAVDLKHPILLREAQGYTVSGYPSGVGGSVTEHWPRVPGLLADSCYKHNILSRHIRMRQRGRPLSKTIEVPPWPTGPAIAPRMLKTTMSRPG